jgi:hypothetical protein
LTPPERSITARIIATKSRSLVGGIKDGQAEGEETRKHGTLAWRVDASGEVRGHEQKAQGRRPPEWTVKVEGEIKKMCLKI